MEDLVVFCVFHYPNSQYITSRSQLYVGKFIEMHCIYVFIVKIVYTALGETVYRG